MAPRWHLLLALPGCCFPTHETVVLTELSLPGGQALLWPADAQGQAFRMIVIDGAAPHGVTDETPVHVVSVPPGAPTAEGLRAAAVTDVGVLLPADSRPELRARAATLLAQLGGACPESGLHLVPTDLDLVPLASPRALVGALERWRGELAQERPRGLLDLPATLAVARWLDETATPDWTLVPARRPDGAVALLVAWRPEREVREVGLAQAAELLVEGLDQRAPAEQGWFDLLGLPPPYVALLAPPDAPASVRAALDRIEERLVEAGHGGLRWTRGTLLGSWDEPLDADGLVARLDPIHWWDFAAPAVRITTILEPPTGIDGER